MSDFRMLLNLAVNTMMIQTVMVKNGFVLEGAETSRIGLGHK